MKNPGEFILSLFNARTAAHVAHLSVSGPGADAAHRALAAFYEGIVGVADRFAEGYIGCEGSLIKFAGSSYKMEKDPIKLVKDTKATIMAARAECADYPFLQQILDDGIELCSVTIYKLTHLK
jgi:DNA-binding ferritin-like protein